MRKNQGNSKAVLKTETSAQTSKAQTMAQNQGFSAVLKYVGSRRVTTLFLPTKIGLHIGVVRVFDTKKWRV